MKIYSFYYQPVQNYNLGENHIPIWAGKNGLSHVEGFTGDDTGDHISSRNSFYSELTGLYWVWKNTRSEIVGSCHYRRYFTVWQEPWYYKLLRLLYHPAGLWKKRFGLIYTRRIQFWKNKIITEKHVKQLLAEYDLILPVARKLKYAVRKHYERYHNIEDLERLESILKENHPEYMNAFHQVMQGMSMFANNMFIMPWDRFDDLMHWLFGILFKFEEETDMEQYDGYQQRIFGFLSERLITIWVLHHELKYKELPLIYFKKLKKELND